MDPTLFTPFDAAGCAACHTPIPWSEMSIISNRYPMITLDNMEDILWTYLVGFPLVPREDQPRFQKTYCLRLLRGWRADRAWCHCRRCGRAACLEAAYGHDRNGFQRANKSHVGRKTKTDNYWFKWHKVTSASCKACGTPKGERAWWPVLCGGVLQPYGSTTTGSPSSESEPIAICARAMRW